MNPSTTIRTIAAQVSDPELRTQLELLASQFETQLNQQNNNWGITFGQMQVQFNEAIDAIRYDMAQDQGQREAQERQIWDAVTVLRADVETLQARSVGETGDGAQ